MTVDGSDGKNGLDGVNGEDGKDGLDIVWKEILQFLPLILKRIGCIVIRITVEFISIMVRHGH